MKNLFEAKEADMSNAIKIESETVKVMKSLFPKPMRVDSPKRFNAKIKDDTYCVLGAMYRYARKFLPDTLVCVSNRKKPNKMSCDAYLDSLIRNFPGGGEAANLLCRLNCNIDKQKAHELASEVVTLNDNGKFGQAWAKLSEAILYKPENANCV